MMNPGFNLEGMGLGLFVTVGCALGILVGILVGGFIAALFRKRCCCFCKSQFSGAKMIFKIWGAVFSEDGFRKLCCGGIWFFLFERPRGNRLIKCSKCGRSMQIVVQDVLKLHFMTQALTSIFLLILLTIFFKNFDSNSLVKMPIHVGALVFFTTFLLMMLPSVFLYGFLPIKKSEEKLGRNGD